MNPRLYSAATTGTDLYMITQFKDFLECQRTGSSNTVLHLASRCGQLETVKLILSLNQELLVTHNENREYPLHLAARGGHSSVVRELINNANQPHHLLVDVNGLGTDTVRWAKDKILKSKSNNDGYTPLHEAVRNRHVDVVKILIEEDAEYSYEDSWETPLYLAARRGFHEVVEVLIKKSKSPAYRGPHGKTALHGAVISNSQKCTKLLLHWRPLRKTLATKTDSYGQTPLHYVAHLGNGADLASSILLSVSYCTSVAYLKDNSNNAAIHIAASRGHVSVLKEIMLRCPDSWDMKGNDFQNILHMAVKHQQKNVITYILEDCPIIDALINQKDNDGNTPLHLLSVSNYYVPQLISHPMVDMGVSNGDKMTALDLLTINVDMSTTTKSEVAEQLKGADTTISLPYHKKEKFIDILAKKRDKGKAKREAPWKREALWERARKHIIVTTLIATITFTAGFTLPGGFIQSNSPNQGMSVLAKSTAFQAFIISDTIALVLSTSAIFIYFIASMRFAATHISTLLLGGIFLNLFALFAMMVAFVTGIYAVLANSLALAVATCLLGSCFFLVYIVVIVKYVSNQIYDDTERMLAAQDD